MEHQILLSLRTTITGERILLDDIVCGGIAKGDGVAHTLGRIADGTKTEIGIAIVGMLGPGLQHVVLACIAAKWPWYARMIRTVTRQYSAMNYISFAKVAGYGTPYILRRHLLPCASGEIAVLATLDTGSVILMLSALSFLGLGVQPPTPEWGMMLGEAKDVMLLYPGQMLPPGLAILLLAAAFNLLGDSLRDAMDPWRRQGAED